MVLAYYIVKTYPPTVMADLKLTYFITMSQFLIDVLDKMFENEMFSC